MSVAWAARYANRFLLAQAMIRRDTHLWTVASSDKRDSTSSNGGSWPEVNSVVLRSAHIDLVGILKVWRLRVVRKVIDPAVRWCIVNDLNVVNPITAVTDIRLIGEGGACCAPVGSVLP